MQDSIRETEVWTFFRDKTHIIRVTEEANYGYELWIAEEPTGRLVGASLLLGVFGMSIFLSQIFFVLCLLVATHDLWFVCASSYGHWDDQSLEGLRLISSQSTRSLEATSSSCLPRALRVLSLSALVALIHTYKPFLSLLLCWFLTTVMSQLYCYRPVMTHVEMIAWSKNI